MNIRLFQNHLMRKLFMKDFIFMKEKPYLLEVFLFKEKTRDSHKFTFYRDSIDFHSKYRRIKRTCWLAKYIRFYKNKTTIQEISNLFDDFFLNYNYFCDKVFLRKILTRIRDFFII